MNEFPEAALARVRALRKSISSKGVFSAWLTTVAKAKAGDLARTRRFAASAPVP
jgi:hypothetical protein